MPDKQSLTTILENPHFNQFAALLSIAMSPKWRMAHPEVPSVRSTIEHRLSRLNRGMLKDATNIKRDFIKEWSTLFMQIVEADPRLHYGVDDYDWFLEVMDGEESIARTTFSMLFAVASTRRQFYSTEQVASFSDKAASTWRNLAAEGKIPGAFQVGNTNRWFFPELSLRAYGVKVPETSIEIIEEESGGENEL